MNRTFATLAIALAMILFTAPAFAQDTLAAVSVPDKELVQAPVGNTAAVAAGDESTMERLTRFCLENLNYGTVTLFMAIESSFIPFPSEAVVPPAAWKAAVTGDMNIFLVVFFATLGALLGALVNYYLALWLGRPIIYRFSNSRIGHMCLLSEEKVKHAEEYFDKHGAISTFVGRLVPAVRQLISIPAGLARMGIARFLLYTTLGAGTWNIILAALGYYMSTFDSLKTEQAVMDAVKEYSSEIGIVFLVLAVVIAGYIIYKGTRVGKK